MVREGMYPECNGVLLLNVNKEGVDLAPFFSVSFFALLF
jgi:hypothetical protein